MPFYRLICRDCGMAYEKQASVSQRAAGEIACPRCGGVGADTDYSAGSAHVKKGREPACPHAGRCGCTGRGCDGGWNT